MIRLIGSRLLVLPPIVLAVAIATFVLVYVSPFDPVEAYVGAESLVSPEAREDIARAWGLDRPLPEQLFRWLRNAAKGDFGASITQGGQPISKIISDRVLPSAVLTGGALLLVLIGGLIAGTAAAAFKDSWLDWLIRTASYFNVAAPSFWVALLAIFVFAVWLGWLPPAGASDFRAVDAPRIEVRHMVLPMATLALTQHAWFTMFVRNTLLEVQREDYVRYAQAQGIGKYGILFRHALPNALVPFATLAGSNLSELIGGSILIETVFSWPGLGSLTRDAALGADIPLLVAIVVLGAVMVILGNLVADILYRVLDPRVRQAASS